MSIDKVTIQDFQKLDIRIGTVIKAEVPEWSHWVMKLTVDFGTEIGKRTIFAGIMHFYKSQDLEGKQFPFVINIERKKMGPEGDFSEGMLLAAVGSRKEKGLEPLKIGGEEIDEYPVLFHLSESLPNGAKVR